MDLSKPLYNNSKLETMVKPLYNFLGFYFERLFNDAVRTKEISSFVIATAANLKSQYIAGKKVIDRDILLALFRLLFGETCPDDFYKWLETTLSAEPTYDLLKKLIIVKLAYSPIYQAFALYAFARLEGKNHNEAIMQLTTLYVPILLASYKYFTKIQLLNFTVAIPPVFEVIKQKKLQKRFSSKL